MADIGRHKLHLHFDNSKCRAAQHVQEQIINHRCVCIPHASYSLDLGMGDFSLFGPLTHQLSGRILDSEENMLETITEILGEPPKDEVISAFVHWKERCQSVANYNGEFYPN
jgi:hypothetical protein